MGNSVVPFLDAFPLTIWVHMDSLMSTSSNDKFANLHVLASVTNLISVQINKYQVMFLTKVLKSVSEVNIKTEMANRIGAKNVEYEHRLY